MLATHALSLSLHSSAPPTARSSCPLPSSRPPLADSTNVNCSSGCLKSFVYPTSATRTGCSWNDVEPPSGATSTPFHPRLHHLSSPSSPFPVTYKAPPTVSISLSAACSQRIPGELNGRTGTQGSESHIRSVVPFPSTPLDGDMDVEMLDGTCNVPFLDGTLQSTPQAPRKRRSAHSSVSSSPGSLGKDTKPKRPRKSRRHVAELWWLGVVHRSILRSIEAREPDSSPSRSHDLQAMDHVLIEKIQKRLAENGYGEGSPPNPFPRISSPSIARPSLSLLAPSRESPPMDSIPRTLSSELDPKANITLSRSAPTSEASPRASLSIISCSSTTASTPSSRRRHVRFEIAQRPRQPSSRPSIPRRSPSPPGRVGTVSNAQTLTLTMAQLVASLTLAYHEKNRQRLRGRTSQSTECGQNAGRSLLSEPSHVALRGSDPIQDMYSLSTLRARLSCTPERKSSLSRVTYAAC